MTGVQVNTAKLQIRRIRRVSSFLHDRNIFKFEGLHLINYREYEDVLLPITFNIIFGPTECYMHLNFFFLSSQRNIYYNMMKIKKVFSRR